MESLYRRFGERTRRYLRGLLGDDADDVQQEVWAVVLRELARVSDVGAFRTWLFRGTRTTALDFLRRRKRLSSVFVTDDEAPDPASGSPPTDPLLRDLVHLPKGRVRGAAILAWAQNYGPAGKETDAEPVVAAARTWTGTPRLLAIHALRFVVHPSADGTLRLLAYDDDPRIAAIASRVIALRERFLLELRSQQPRPTSPVPTDAPVGPTGAPRP